MLSKRARQWCIALIVVLASYTTYRCTLHLVQARLDEIRRQGYPVTLAELDKWYPQPPPGENAAEIYGLALLKFHETGWYRLHLLQPSYDDYNTEWPKRTKGLSNEMRATV